MPLGGAQFTVGLLRGALKVSREARRSKEEGGGRRGSFFCVERIDSRVEGFFSTYNPKVSQNWGSGSSVSETRSVAISEPRGAQTSPTVN